MLRLGWRSVQLRSAAELVREEDLAQAMKFVAALHPRASVHDLTLYPTFPKVYSAAETGLPT